MNLTGQTVIHKKYGIGQITKIIDNHVYIKFQDHNELKTFIYPSCFENGFLKLKNENIVVKQQPKRIKTKRNQTSKSVDLFYEKYKKALQEEISYLRKNGGKKQKLSEGKLIEFKKGKYIYSFESDIELSYPEGTPIIIWHRQVTSQGTIAACEDYTVIIETEAKLGRDIPTIDISPKPWRLLNALIERMENINDHPSDIVKSLVCDGKNAIDNSDSEIKKGQKTALKMSFNQPITLIWGPPGTGKTQTLANIALKHMEKGERVLMLSYSNVSVDGALLRTARMAKDKMKPGIFVRYGYPKEKALLEHEYLTSYNLAIHKHQDLLYKREQLLERRKYITRTSPEYVRIEEDLKNIRFRLMAEEKDCVKHARFVAMTVSKAVVDPTIYESNFDIVIFDEASMAYVPQIVFSASLAAKHFVCMGDFRQLPPIVQSSTKSALNIDIFEYCNIVKAVEHHRKHQWLCMLDVQYRMHPKIADFVSKTMYHDLLKTSSKIRENEFNMEVTKQKPLINQPIVLADLSRMSDACMKTSDNSRINIQSAFLAFYMALQINKKYKVGIITPYHAQSRLLNAMIKDIMGVHPEINNISSATVHQFQGSEKDVILYDAVDSEPMKAPGMLLTSTQNDYANRLFNVALTRARGKFICLANVDYMNYKNLSKDLLFMKMINEQKCNSYKIKNKNFGNTDKEQLESIRKFYKEKGISFEGSNTAFAIYGFMEEDQTIGENESKDDTFAVYVRSHKKCPDCGKPMRLAKSKKGNFFLSCTAYPKCKTTEFVDVWFVEEYLNRNGGTGQKCTKCKYSLMAERGRYGGVEVHCCGYPQHEYELDEI